MNYYTHRYKNLKHINLNMIKGNITGRGQGSWTGRCIGRKYLIRYFKKHCLGAKNICEINGVQLQWEKKHYSIFIFNKAAPH